MGEVDPEWAAPTQQLLLLLPPAMALIFAWFASRSVAKGAAEIDAMRAELKRKRQSPAE